MNIEPIIVRAWKEGNEVGDCSFVCVFPTVPVSKQGNDVLTWTPSEGLRRDGVGPFIHETERWARDWPQQETEALVAQAKEALQAYLQVAVALVHRKNITPTMNAKRKERALLMHQNPPAAR